MTSKAGDRLWALRPDDGIDVSVWATIGRRRLRDIPTVPNYPLDTRCVHPAFPLDHFELSPDIEYPWELRAYLAMLVHGDDMTDEELMRFDRYVRIGYMRVVMWLAPIGQTPRTRGHGRAAPPPRLQLRPIKPHKRILPMYSLASPGDRNARLSICKHTKQGKPSERFATTELGLTFVERAWRLLHEGGRLGIVLPETYFFSSSYRWFRE